MRKVFLITLLILFVNQIFSQVNNRENFIKITKAYLEFQIKEAKANIKDDKILILEVQSIGKDSLRFGVSMVNISLLYGLKYSKVYQLDGFKLAIREDLAESSTLKGLFKEIPYEDLNKATLFLDLEYNTWYITLDKKNNIISVKSKYPFNDVLKVLRKNNVNFSRNFHFNRSN